ncbi:MAG: NAD-dependent epimerase/dehydratase family protein [Myxococcota bacterium]|nr:NAD-dependent epimerase/dehydratase family protein [Myxococcales bacterium]
MSADRVLVTGGAGFIGSHLVEHLLAEGLEVRVLDDFSRGSRANLAAVGAADCEIIDASVCDADAVHRAAKGVRWIHHLAAIPSVVESVAQPARTNAINVEGTLHVLDAARASRVERVVFASSCAIYGDGPELPKLETLPPRPASPYALQKRTCEQYCRLYGELYALEAVPLRFFNVFGPRQDPYSDYAAVVPRFALAAVRGEAVRIYGDGGQTRDFVYVGDIARACHVAAQTAGIAGEIINVARGEATSISELAELVGRCVGRPLAIEHFPERAGEVRDSVADTSRASGRMGFRAAVDLEEGLRRTVESFTKAELDEAAAAGARAPERRESAR